MKKYTLIFLIFVFTGFLYSQPSELDKYNIVWTSQSKNSSESMPCGGGDIGLNVWVENGELLMYVSRSGAFDESNGFLKLGRVRLKLDPNPFEGQNFRQELVLKDGYVKINAGNACEIFVWVDVFRPLIHIEVNGKQKTIATASYENWRYSDILLRKGESFFTSLKWSPLKDLKTFKDEISFNDSEVVFYHRNKPDFSIFDITIHQQGLDSVKNQMYNPVKELTFGGYMKGNGMKAIGVDSGKYVDTRYYAWKLQSEKLSSSHHIELGIHIAQTPSVNDWMIGLKNIKVQSIQSSKKAKVETRKWWNDFWNRSFISINPENTDISQAQWQVGRNYQLFRYMLGCNAYAIWPTKFNGGLFTYDPVFTDTSKHFTPDYRNWCGGTMTAQNQRLVYFPMIKSGDFDMMLPQFDFYNHSLRNAELRSEVYWGHKGACFTEQIENFGLPNVSEYGWNRPDGYDKGLEYNAWLEYEWDTALEFCLMILETERYNNTDITQYLPMIKSCLTFFNEHYQYLAKKRGSKAFDGEGHLIFYPGSAGETYKMAYNASSTIAALKTVTERLLELPAKYIDSLSRKNLTVFLSRIPPISYRQFNGYNTISPAKLWERVNNTEPMQLYPVFPWGIYGVGKPGLDTAINTWKYDPDALKFRSHVGWKQDNIWAARLGLTSEAADLAIKKLKDSGRRFPAFWGPGFDWTPDHNWGGSGMIGLQEMLLQVDGKKIYLFPAWPKEWDVHFKLHAPYNTIVEGVLKNGELIDLKVLPEIRKNDIILKL